MSDAKEEVCKAWNKLFSDLNMRVSDLTNPTEAFLSKTLVYYLRAFGYKVEGASVENTREKRLFLIKLARHTEHILQITLKTLSFTYYDLFKPSSKKTMTTLSILFNYLCYYNMYKKDVFSMCEDRLKTFDELKAQITRIKNERDELNKNIIQTKVDIEDITSKILNMETQYETQCAEKLNLQKSIQKLKIEIEDVETQLATLNTQKVHLESFVVPDSLMEELESKKMNMVQQMTQYKEETLSHKGALDKRKACIDSNNKICALIVEAQEILPVQLVKQFEDFNKRVKDLEKEHATQLIKKEELKKNIKKLQKKSEQLEQKYKLRKQNMEQEQQVFGDKIKERDSAIIELTKELNQCLEIGHNLEHALIEEYEIEEFLQQSAEYLRYY